MRVVFLDFDGVLNAETGIDEPLGGSELWSADWLDAGMVARLSELVERAKALVVISSSWRQRRSLDELEEMLRSRGFRGEICDITPRLPRPPEGERLVRAAEIATWLAGSPHTDRFVILDDEPDFGDLAPYHVRTDPRIGLTSDDVTRALAILGAGP